MIRNLISLILARGGVGIRPAEGNERARVPGNNHGDGQRRPSISGDMSRRTSPGRTQTAGRLPNLSPNGVILIKVGRVRYKTVGVFSPSGPILEGRIVYMWVQLYPGERATEDSESPKRMFRSGNIFRIHPRGSDG